MKGPWLHGAVIHMLENNRADPNNTEMDSYLLAMPHLLVHAGKEGLMAQVGRVADILSTCDSTRKWVRAQAEILEQVVLDGRLAVDESDDNDWVEDVTEMMDWKHITVTKTVGNNCHLPGTGILQ